MATSITGRTPWPRRFPSPPAPGEFGRAPGDDHDNVGRTAAGAPGASPAATASRTDLPFPLLLPRIPVFPRDQYRSYLRGPRLVVPKFTPLNTPCQVTIDVDEFDYTQPSPGSFQGSFSSVPGRSLRFVLSQVPPPSPLPSLRSPRFESRALEGGIDRSQVTLRWVSGFLRRAVLEIDTLLGAVPPLPVPDTQHHRNREPVLRHRLRHSRPAADCRPRRGPDRRPRARRRHPQRLLVSGRSPRPHDRRAQGRHRPRRRTAHPSGTAARGEPSRAAVTARSSPGPLARRGVRDGRRGAGRHGGEALQRPTADRALRQRCRQSIRRRSREGTSTGPPSHGTGRTARNPQSEGIDGLIVREPGCLHGAGFACGPHRAHGGTRGDCDGKRRTAPGKVRNCQAGALPCRPAGSLLTGLHCSRRHDGCSLQRAVRQAQR